LLERLESLVGASDQELADAAAQAVPQSAQTVSVHLAIVTAASGRSAVVRSITRPHFGLGGSVISTATPAAAAVRLLGRGMIAARGVLPPERCIDPRQMFAELEARGASFSVTGTGSRRSARLRRRVTELEAEVAELRHPSHAELDRELHRISEASAPALA